MHRTLRGVDIHYEQAGQGADVLLLHGWGCQIKHFQPIMDELAKDHRVTALDFPAHGASGEPEGAWGVGDFAGLTRELMLALDIAPCDIIAHSFGGRVALYIAANWPETVKRLILTGCAGLKKPETKQSRRKSARYRAGKRVFAALSGLGGPFRALGEKGQAALVEKYGSADYKALSPGMRQTFVKVISEDLSPLLPQVKASTLLVWGENDTETPLWMGQRMEKEIADAGLVVFENDDHFAYLRQWPRFVRVAQAFLK